MNIYNYFNKLKNAMLISLGITSIIFAFKAFFDFLAFKTSNEIISFKNLSSCLAFFAPLAISFFTTFYLINGRKTFKALFTLFCAFVFYSVFTQSKSYFFAVLISLLAYYCYKNLNFVTASLLLLSSTLIFSVLCTYLYDVYNNLIMDICGFVSNKGNISSAMFGFVNTLLSPLDFSSFENMFSYLIFLIIGVFSSLIKELKGIEKAVLCIIVASSILCGNVTLFMFFVFLESPYLFLSLCVISSLGYFCASIVKISVGFSFGGGIIEIFINADKYVYLITLGIVFTAIGYFVTKYFYEKYGISSLLNIYIPKNLKNTVSALGGVQNIIRFSDTSIEVRNPKLVDEISLDCEIKENIIKIEKDIVDNLKEYFD